MTETSSSLLARVKENKDPRAWTEFFNLYRPLCLRWVRVSGVPTADVEDVVQNVLLRVCRAMPKFTYDRDKGGFRKYLSRAVRSGVADYWKSRRRQPPHIELVDPDLTVADPNEQVWEQEYTDHLLETCLRRARQEVSPETWEAFVLYNREDRSAKEVAAILGITPQIVYNRAFAVMQKLRELARDIDPGAGFE